MMGMAAGYCFLQPMMSSLLFGVVVAMSGVDDDMMLMFYCALAMILFFMSSAEYRGALPNSLDVVQHRNSVLRHGTRTDHKPTTIPIFFAEYRGALPNSLDVVQHRNSALHHGTKMTPTNRPKFFGLQNWPTDV